MNFQWDSATRENCFCDGFSESGFFSHVDKSGMLLLGLESVDVLRAARWKQSIIKLFQFLVMESQPGRVHVGVK